MPTTTQRGINLHENQTYKIVVGVPPATRDVPNPFPAYLIVNKETGVTESWHGVLFYAKQNADFFNEMLVNPPKKEEETQAKGGSTQFSFN